MTENKRYTWNSEDVVINDNVTGKQLEVVDITEIDGLLDLLNGQDERIKDLLKELKQYKLNCLWCSYCTMDSASIHCLKREDIPYGMIDGKTHEYAMTCEFYDGDME